MHLPLRIFKVLMFVHILHNAVSIELVSKDVVTLRDLPLDLTKYVVCA